MAKPPPEGGWLFSDGSQWPMGENEERWQWPVVQGPHYLSREHFELSVETEVAWASWQALDIAQGLYGKEREACKEWQLWEHARDALMTFETGRVRCEHCKAIVQKRGLKRHQKTMPCVCVQNSNEMKALDYVLCFDRAYPLLSKEAKYLAKGPLPYYYHVRMYNSPYIGKGIFLPRAVMERYYESLKEKEAISS